MNYDLALKLKEAGFPQIYPLTQEPLSEETKAAYVHIPTLSELIEACGEKFWSLDRNGSSFLAVGRKTKDDGCYDSEGDGSTPEEAVANLWLELNKKHG